MGVSTDGAKMETCHTQEDMNACWRVWQRNIASQTDTYKKLCEKIFMTSTASPTVVLNKKQIQFPGMPSGAQGTSEINAFKMTIV